MQTFRVFFRLLAKNKASIIIYAGIFIAVSIIITKSISEDNGSGFETTNVKIAVFDHDNSKLSKAIKEFLCEGNELVKVEDDTKIIKKAVFNRDIYYALIIPEGYGEKFGKDDAIELESIKVTDAIQGYKIDIILENYIKSVKLYSEMYEIDEAVRLAADTAKLETKVKLADEMTSNSSSSDTGFTADYYYFSYLPYILMAIIISTICPIILAFTDVDIRRRINVSKMKFFVHNASIAAGVAVFALVIDMVFSLVGVVLYHNDMTPVKVGLYFVNMVVFSLVAVAIAFLGGNLFKKSSTAAAFSTSVSLGIAFLGGVFVPLSVLGDTMKMIAKAIPAYYYIDAQSDIIGVVDKGAGLSDFAVNIFIMIGFATVIFAVGLIFARKKIQST